MLNLAKRIDMGITSIACSHAQKLKSRGEDRYSTQILENGVFYAGIYDGHNGSEAATLCAQMMPEIINAEYRSQKPTINILRNAFLKCDRNVTGNSGTTASVVLLCKNYLVVAHVGDSRVVICHKGNAVNITEDHHIEWEPERDRIKEAERLLGISLICGQRVDGLMLTRSIGDHNLSNVILAYPVVHELFINDDDDFIIMASDGFWDVCSGSEATQLIKARNLSDEREIAEMLVFYASGEYKKRGIKADDISCVIINLHKKTDMIHFSEDSSGWSFESMMKSDSATIRQLHDIIL